MPTDDPSPGRAGFGCLVTLATFTIPIGVALVVPGPWWAGFLAGMGTAVLTFIGAAAILPPLMRVADAVPADATPTPGPDDPVYLIDYDKRDTFDCGIHYRHAPHHAFYRTVMPYLDGDGRPAEAPMSGSRWCTGRGVPR